VAVGRAIVRKPAVSLFDEPLSNLDAKLRVKMRAEFFKLRDHLQTTIIFVTHDQVEAMIMGTNIRVMKFGPMTSMIISMHGSISREKHSGVRCVFMKRIHLTSESKQILNIKSDGKGKI
jgi:ABC-type sugar transport system ATPase subunit